MQTIDPKILLIRARVITMLNALEMAGTTPISGRTFHAFAYFANVLSPLWDIDPLDGSVLKDEDGPYFPDLQRQVDYLISNGAIDVAELATQPSGISVKFQLNYEIANPILGNINALPDEAEIAEFMLKLGFAFVEIVADRRSEAATVDASWSDPSIDDGRVIDYGELVSATYDNAAWNVSQRLQDYAPVGVTLNRSEKLLMYMRLMKKRASG